MFDTLKVANGFNEVPIARPIMLFMGLATGAALVAAPMTAAGVVAVLEPATILNGKEYWKILGLLTNAILMP